jgi:rRNA-processing protein FCF1
MNSDTQQVSNHEALIRVAVNDANLLIDLWDINLIAHFFQLPLAFHTTQLIISELEPEQIERLRPYIDQQKLIIRNLTRAEIDSLENISVNSRKLSRQDLSVYFYAKELNDCMILTGDNRLRKEAERQHFEVHGILWVFEQMIANRILSPVLAVEHLQNLMQINAWLPISECQKCLEKWGKNGEFYTL